MKDREDITFEIYLKPVYADVPPGAQIFINDECKYDGLIDNDTVVKFNHTLYFNQQHQLRIHRYNKEKSRPVNDIHQTLILDKIIIDGVDIQNIIFSRSYNEPDYPEHWAKQNPDLQKTIIAETHFGFNGVWRLNFTSPFYMFVMNCVAGRMNNVSIY
jgi:hypothetical protein